MEETVDTLLDARTAEGCRRLLELSGGSGVDGFLSRFGRATLAGMVEYFLASARHPKAGRMRSEIRRQTNPLWKSVLTTWSGKVDESEPFQSAEIEFRKIQPENWTGENRGWHLYERRFLASLRAAGFESRFAHGVLKAFAEMSENVVQHSVFEGNEAEGLAGYHVGPSRFAFSICDLGCGFLRSLHEHTRWSRLSSEKDAILAVVHESASRRVNQGEGEGFKELWKALADHGAVVRLRSGDTVATIRMINGGRVAEISSMPLIAGAHLSVFCTLGKQSLEKDLEISLLNHSNE